MSSNDSIQLVVFRLSGENYGFRIESVREIERFQNITKVPQAPEFVQGVVNLRGVIIPVINLASRFGYGRGQETGETRIIVIQLGDSQIGVIVDEVTEVLRITSEAIQEPTGFLRMGETGLITGIAKLQERLIVVLDPHKLLTSQEMAHLDSIHV